MKKIFLVILLTTITFSLSYSQNNDGMPGTGTLYGKDSHCELGTVAISDLNETYLDKEIQIEGTVSEVCQSMGCWTIVTDGTNNIKASTKHKFFLPKDSAGKKAVVQGKYIVKVLSVEDQMHYYEEQGKTPDKPITEPKKDYQIEATGIKLLD